MANKQDYIREITLLNYNDASGADEGMDFFWKEYTNANFNGVTPTANYDNVPSNWSWIVPYDARGNAEPSLVATPYYMEGAMLYVKLTATITTSENGVDLVLNTQGKSACGCLPNYSFYTLKADQTNGLYTNNGLVVNEYTFWHYWIWVNGSDANYYRHFDTLAECFTHLIYNVRNINIIVDNEDWTERTPAYNWVSVPSVSGKNGILFLSTIQSVYLNNGDPVNNAPANYIQFADDSNVAILVGEQVDDPTLVTIQYIVPTGTYEYIKLVYKVDSAPTSITDGTAVDILQANRSVTISGIANGNTYFFKIFTDVSESEPYEFTTTKPPIASNYVFELDLSTDGKDIVRYDATKDIGNHKQGELYGSGISIEDGILTTSSWIYWDYDGTENPKFIPANCTLTFEYDAFFPNGEGYLDWYVIDSNGNERIYWCFDTQHAFQSNKWYNCKTVAKVQNGKIVRYKYVLDGNEISSNTADINMPCVNTETSLGISRIYFRLTRTTKFKNMAIYFDFSEYHDGGGSGSGSSGRA